MNTENKSRGIMINFTMTCGIEKAKQIISEYNGHIKNDDFWANSNILTIETPLSYRAVVTSLNSVHRDFVQNAKIIN